MSHCRAQLATVQPNAAHLALANAAATLTASGGQLTLITQNVDDLHERAGSETIHMHGELAVLRCEQCDTKLRDLERTNPDEFLPCGSCGHARLRPHIVWFGEVPFGLDEIHNQLLACTHFLAIGTSGQVWPAAGMLQTARDLGAKTYVQALELPANADARDTFAAGRAAEVVPDLLQRIMEQV